MKRLETGLERVDRDEVALARDEPLRAVEVVGEGVDQSPRTIPRRAGGGGRARKSDGKPDEGYLGAVRKRFGQWVKDTCAASYDQKWLDYQFEIGRRHHRSGKDKTDGVNAEENVPMRHIIALIAPITLTVRPFLEKSGKSAAEVEKMHQAWFKTVTLHAALWCHPYAKEGDF